MSRLIQTRVGNPQYNQAGASRATPFEVSWRPSSYLVDVARGLTNDGARLVHKFGSNSDVDTGTDPEDVWQAGGLMTWPSTAGVLNVVSSSIKDVYGTGLGAHVVVIEGLDASFNEIVKEVELNGTTSVSTEVQFLRVNRAYVTQVGKYHGTNDGLITIELGESIMATILPGCGQTQIARYTVPANHSAYFLSGTCNVSVTKTAGVRFIIYPNADVVSAPFTGAERVIIDQRSSSGTTYRADQAVKIPEKTDIWARVENVGANDTSVDVEFQLLLVPEA